MKELTYPEYVELTHNPIVLALREYADISENLAKAYDKVFMMHSDNPTIHGWQSTKNNVVCRLTRCRKDPDCFSFEIIVGKLFSSHNYSE